MEHNDCSFDCIVLTETRAPVCSILKRKTHEITENAHASCKRSKSVVFGSEQVLYIPKRKYRKKQIHSFFEIVCITVKEHVLGILDVFFQMGSDVHTQTKTHGCSEDQAVQDIDQE
tara:strand:- start:10267 stop:10614 length:348 start_codon:yes stop_codon:yes gene_type:complete